MIVHQISIFLENRAGQLAQVTRVLADNNIDMRAISIAETTDYGVLRLIVNGGWKEEYGCEAAKCLRMPEEFGTAR